MIERLQKYMASCGIASRRKCEELILSGDVKVNGKIVTELGIKVDVQNDTIEYKGSVITPEERKVYIMLNKPEGYICSVKDEKGRKTVIDIVDVEERIYPIGRLDYDSSGLLLLTNDGEVYNKIIHPRVELKKSYIAECKGVFTESEIKEFKNGIDIGGYVTAPADIEIIDVERNNKNGDSISTAEIKIHEGKNRQIRKMCSKLYHEVITLKRISIGDIKLGHLKKGQWRNLTREELEYLMSL